MSQIFHEIEKKIINSLQKKLEQTPEQLSESTKLSIDQIRRGIEWLRLKELAQVNESSKVTITLGKNGIDAFKNGLPERKLMELIKDSPKTFDDVRTMLSGVGFNAAIANAKVVIAQVNKQMPRTHGDGLIHISEINSFVECDIPLPTLNFDAPSETENKIVKAIKLTDDIFSIGIKKAILKKPASDKKSFFSKTKTWLCLNINEASSTIVVAAII